MVYKLYYFDFHGGAGEPIRNAFRLSKTSFEDIRVKRDEWPNLKVSDKCMYGQMPLLEIDGNIYAQSMAILRYVGKVTGLYPTDPIEALRVDELLDAIIDIRTKISPTYSLPDAERIAARQKLVETFIRPHLEKIECRVGKSGIAVGSKITIADLAIANEIDGLRSGRLDGIDAHVADGLGGIEEITKHVRHALDTAK
jgi:glutathione S-transferase